MVHVTCPACGEMGTAINEPCSTEYESNPGFTLCYGDFGVVIHWADEPQQGDRADHKITDELK